MLSNNNKGTHQSSFIYKYCVRCQIIKRQPHTIFEEVSFDECKKMLSILQVIELGKMVENEKIDSKYGVIEDINATSELELSEAKTCCRCNQETEDIYESENCEHGVCVGCRFKDSVHCIFCITNDHDEAGPINETGSSSLDNSSYTKKKAINKEHLVDVQQDGTTNAPKQKCTVCQRVFLKTNAPYHYACASGKKPLVCSECGRRFVKKSHLQSHLNSHFGIKPFKCTVNKCTASFTQKDKLVRHVKTHASEKRMCPVCDKMYSSLPILQYHMKKVHASVKVFKCDMCPRTYKYKRTLSVHRLKHHELKEHLCEICGKKYTVAAQLKQHMRSHVPIYRRPYKCRHNCKRRFTTLHDKARHQLIHDHTSSPDFECSLCNTTFGRKDNLERHMKNFHQEPLNLGITNKMAEIASHSNINHSNLETQISINLKHTNTFSTQSKCSKNNLTEILQCSNKEKTSNNSRKLLKFKKKNQFKPQLNINEAAQPIVDPIDKLNQKEIYQATSVIVRPSVIKNAPKLLQKTVIPSEKWLANGAYNMTNYYGTALDQNTATNLTGIIGDTNLNSSNIQYEKLTTLKNDAVNMSFRIIYQTDHQKEHNLSNRNVNADNCRYPEDNMRSNHFESLHNVSIPLSPNPVKEYRFNFEEGMPQLQNSSTSHFPDISQNNLPNSCIPHCSTYNPLNLNEYYTEDASSEEKMENDLNFSFQYTYKTKILEKRFY